MIRTQTAEEFVVTENWELARQAVSEGSDFIEDRRRIEDEFGISLDDIGTIIDLPQDVFKKLQKRLLGSTSDYFKSRRAEMHKKICVDLNYCEAKKTRTWRVAEYVLAVGDLFLTGGGGAIAILALKTEVLDELCGCKG